jgi:hypothetical protein
VTPPGVTAAWWPLRCKFGSAGAGAESPLSRLQFARSRLAPRAAIGITVLGVVNPNVIQICFAPDDVKVVCPTSESPLPQSAATASTALAQTPTPAQASVEAVTDRTTSKWDLPVIELVGLIAAAVAAAASLSRIKGTSIPYSLPVALSLLKLPTGALTALLGLLLMRGEFVPGLSALDSSGQIIAWAVVFGAAQHLVTRLVDQQAQTVLEGVGTPASAAADGR